MLKIIAQVIFLMVAAFLTLFAVVVWGSYPSRSEIAQANGSGGAGTLGVSIQNNVPPADPPPPPCHYPVTGPIRISSDGQVVHDLTVISSPGHPAIDFNGHSYAGAYNVEVRCNSQPCIKISGGKNNWLSGVSVRYIGAPAAGYNQATGFIGVSCINSAGFYGKRLRFRDTSAGVSLQGCHHSTLTGIEGYDMRGPYPRGQLVQWINSSWGSLANFSLVNDPVKSRPEDGINLYLSDHITISDGLLDGNNSLRGVGVQYDLGAYMSTTANVDAVRHLNGCFAAYGPPKYAVSFNHTRCRDMVLAGVLGPASSGTVAFIGAPPGVSVSGIEFFQNEYYGIPNGRISFSDASMATHEFANVNFTARAPFRAGLCGL